MTDGNDKKPMETKAKEVKEPMEVKEVPVMKETKRKKTKCLSNLLKI